MNSRVDLSSAFEMLERSAVKVARSVPRGVRNRQRLAAYPTVAEPTTHRSSLVIVMFTVIFGGGCGESPRTNDPEPASQPATSGTPMTEADPAAPERRMIDYGHMRDGVLYHGTISDLDGKPKATWTFELDGEKTTRTRKLTEEQFDSILNGTIDSDIFESSLITDPETPIDPIANHIIAVYYSNGDTESLRSYSIPGNEDDPAFLRWLELLRIPEGSL
ncbi:MAG: hypothetical protein MI919_00460 [Holophagales bacterium]|nr:hypothetical protein [Holophagales bacterium]